MKQSDLMTLLGKIPTTWDETIILKAEFGRYIVEARRKGDEWYVAAINDWTPEEFTIPAEFLKNGLYEMEYSADGINAARNPQDYKIVNTGISQNDNLKIKLAPGGGYIAHIYKKQAGK
jgi:alpha-glucosidase